MPKPVEEAPRKQTATNAASHPAMTANWMVAGICILLAGMVCAVYGQTLRHQFVSYDDSVYIYENPVVKKGLTLKGIEWALKFGEFGHWHPVTWFSHMLDCQIYGLWAGGHHLTNVLLHTAAAVLLFLVLRQITGALWRSAFVAAVFAVHPLHVESVAWVAERKDVLSGLFFMLTLGAYARYARKTRPAANYTAVVALFAIGLMCKGMLVTLPFVLLLLDWWPLGRWEPYALVDGPRPSQEKGEPLPRLVLEKIPLFALSAVSCAITSLAPEKVDAVDQLSFLPRMENAVVACVIYLRQMVWPSGLAVPYPNPTGDLPLGEVLPALALLAAITAAVFVLGKTRPWLAVGWFWYLGMLAPVIGIVQISTYAHADRYTYLPQIGLYIAVAWLAAEGFASLRHRRLAAGCVSAIVLAALGFSAWIQASYWKDDEALWTRTLAVIPDNAAAHNNLGRVVEEKGRMDEAMAHYRKAIQIEPTLAKAHFNLGNALLNEDKPDEAIAEFEKALKIQPDYADAQNSLGNAFMKKGEPGEAAASYEKALKIQPRSAEALYNLGNVLLQNGRADEAAAYFQKALEIQPDLAAANYNLGMILLQQGQPEEAIACFKKALAANPRDAEAHVSLGNALMGKGLVDEAIGHFQQALEIQPNLAKAHINLAVALVEKGRLDEAVVHLQKALEIEPGLAKAHSNLGVIFLRQGRLDEAISHFQKALEIQPDLAEAHYNLGISLAQKGQFGEAIAHLQKTLEIQPGYTDAQISLAHVLATCPQASLRDGAKALELAQQANQATGGSNADVLGTLAEAYAECGHFDEAAGAAQRALDLANSQSNAVLADLLRSQIALYKANKPFRDNAARN